MSIGILARNRRYICLAAIDSLTDRLRITKITLRLLDTRENNLEANLKERLTADIRQALRDGDKLKRSVLQMVLAAVQNAEIAKRAALENSDVIGILAKEAKQHQESIEAFTQGNRPELAAKEKTELAILEEYLPSQITRDELVTEARRIIAEVGAQGPGDKGKVMPRIIAQLKGKAEGKDINEVVTELLGS